jgi:hypothetical protein
MSARRTDPTPSLFPLPMVPAADLASLESLCRLLLDIQNQLAANDTAEVDPALFPSLNRDAGALGRLILALNPQ